MTGRNSKPDQDGKVSSPGRLDQFGQELAEDFDELDAAAAPEACRESETAE
ncbi:hypothetical protein J31TS4_40950 [Paenibacillus sp. J31TS4]|uniref:hypothetical protein n=1 Tax=Paenibacillus sp. J31TS4 TaxID=2807195 RepID=UPI001B032FBA|nr:hypothetical protein [Paenibacillus sp. J31TS4]GIP40815.1 hypothetical protein J31TS4_40950 [Paenibacillus sp. J31TS4]